MDSISFSWDCISHHTLLEKSWYLGRMSLSWCDCKVTLIEYLARDQNGEDVAKFRLAEWQQFKKMSLSQTMYFLAWSKVFFFTMASWSYLVPKINFSWALNNQNLLLFILQLTNNSNGLIWVCKTSEKQHGVPIRGCMQWDASSLDHSYGMVHRCWFFI